MSADSNGQGGRGWVSPFTELFAEVFASSPRISASRYSVYNAVLGVVLLIIGTLMFLEPARASPAAAFTLGTVGVVFLLGVVVNAVWPGVAPRTLTLHGVLLAALAVVLAASSVEWALRAPPGTPFRYAPALTLMILTYGMLQVAAFGPWPEQSRRLRLFGLWGGVFCELTVLASFVLRALR